MLKENRFIRNPGIPNVAEGEHGHLHGDLSDEERLRSVGEELVEEGQEGAREQPREPHPEGPYRLGRVVGVLHC